MMHTYYYVTGVKLDFIMKLTYDVWHLRKQVQRILIRPSKSTSSKSTKCEFFNLQMCSFISVFLNSEYLDI